MTPNFTNSAFSILTKTAEAFKPTLFKLAKGVEIITPNKTDAKPINNEKAVLILYK